MPQPETSQEANDLKSDESKRKDYVLILDALKVIEQGHYEDIGLFLNVSDLNKISRRLKEMRELGMIENTGIKKLTTRKRNAFIHKLSTDKKPVAEEKTIRKSKPLVDDKNKIVVSAYVRRKKVDDTPSSTNQNFLF